MTAADIVFCGDVTLYNDYNLPSNI